jgi:hypothetical protein
MLEAPFATRAGENLSVQNTRENLLNMYVEKAPGGRGQILRTQRAGLKKNASLSGEARGVQNLRGNDYAVVGSGFYRLSTTEAFLLGTLETETGKCSFAENATQIAICDGFSLYCFDGTVLTKTTLPDGIVAGSVSGLDGYALINDRNSGKFYRTDLNDFKTVGALNFATAESQPDKLVRVFVDHREVWLAGQTSIEVWGNTGASGFSFSRVQGIALERGCAAAHSFAAEDNTVFWLGNDGFVYRADGYRPARISDEQIERLIASAAPWSDAHAWVYAVPGHKFYVLTFPGRLTVVYDITSGLWHQAKTWGSESWDVVGPVKLGASVVLAHSGICQLVKERNTDNDGIMERKATAPPIYSEGKRIAIDAYWLDVDVGTSLSSVSPSVMLTISRDGETFGNVRTRGLGAIGDYVRRAVWRNLGVSRKWTFSVSVTDDVPFTVVSGRMSARVMGS